MTINLSGDNLGSFYSGSSCITPITTITIGTSQAVSPVFYYKNDLAESLTFKANAPGYTEGQIGVTVNPGSATVLAISGPACLSTSVCAPVFSVTSQDPFGNLSNVTSNTTVTLDDGVASGSFWNNPACSTGSGTLTINSGTNSGVFYYKNSVTETPLITADDTTPNTLTSDTYTVYVGTAGPPAQLDIAGPTSLSTETCYGPYDVIVKDGCGNEIIVGTGTLIELTGGGKSRYYSDSCSTQVTNITVLSGNSRESFYYKNTSSGIVRICKERRPSTAVFDAGMGGQTLRLCAETSAF